jgi:riboflavin kinase/FMN adenylyltransferase
MQVFRSLEQVPAGFGPSVVTIGNFDGVHRGHQWIIGEVRTRAAEISARSVAVTFEPHPTRVLRPEMAPRLITPLPQRLDLLAQTGIDDVLVLPFTPALAQMSAREFVQTILCGSLRAAEIHEGENFRFGHRAQAGAEELIALGGELCFSVRIYPPRSAHGLQVSSSQVRDRIAGGDMTKARALLGRPFAIRSTPASGRGIGTRLLVPTVNLAPYQELLPAHGVYVTCLRIGQGDRTEVFESVTNAGNRPTFGADSYAIESHILNFHPIELAPDTPLELAFLHRIRGEQRFPSPEALKAQIFRDVASAQRYFHLTRLLAIQPKPAS